ncbi:class III lanthionine synthetase LanKC [Streptomyces sp. 4N509B]|uniref:class III lanthionine synthetase LanKC n=1 Tax=Streptomyces sp. 4N509B TaxID=3457413 RepID=UPI003FD0B60A
MQVEWATVQAYMAHHPRWFENYERRPPSQEHLLVYRSVIPGAWRLSRRGYWLISEPPRVPPVAQGWKLHVSATSATTTATLRAALPVLRDARVHFKFLMDPAAMRETNGKLFPRGASGKFITVYPADEAEFRAVGDALTRALDGFEGPHVLSDRRYPGSGVVYYRYGGFTTISRVLPAGNRELLIHTPDGEPVVDVRHPYFHTPDWVTDPFPPDATSGTTSTTSTTDGDADGPGISLAQGRFTVTSAMQFSNRGGLYRAVDNETGADVVLREARPGVQVGPAGLDAVDVLRHEYDILTELADTGLFVRPVALFREWEHTFVAEEFVPGTYLGNLNTAHNPVYTLELTPEKLTDYYDRFRGLWLQVADAIAVCHERGIVLGDLSPTNIMVTPDDRIRVIDMESAFHEDAPEGPARGAGLFTPGMTTRRAVRARRGDRATDYYALGGLILGSIVLCHQPDILDPTIPRRVLAEAAADLDVPAGLVSLVSDLYDEDAAAPDPAEVRRRIEELPLTTHWRRPPPLALPAATDADARAALHKRVDAVLDGVVSYWTGTADLTRDDRLFPADLQVFETSPLTLAHGAYGTLYALHRLRGGVPEDLLGWALRQSTSPDTLPPGLYHGSAGVAWAQAELGHRELAVRTLRDAADHPQLYAEPGVVAGAAGYGMACLRLWRDTGLPEFLDRARAVGDHLAATAHRPEGRGQASWPSAEGRTLVGYAAGASGVALFLLALHAATGDAGTLALGREALDFDLAQAVFQPSGVHSFPAAAVADDEPVAVVRHYLDYGTAGVLTALLRYHHVTGDPVLRERVAELLPDVRRKYTVLPQLFHGTSGLGHALLDAYEFLGEAELLAEAERMAAAVLCTAVERPEGIVFPGEQAVRESCDLATGSAGVALFLDRLRHARPGGRSNPNFLLDDLLPATDSTDSTDSTDTVADDAPARPERAGAR